jgi:DNA-binding XRE family transcriptional regulator
MTTEIYKKQLKDLSELKDLGLSIIGEDETTVENKLQKILKEKGLLISDLSKLTGISRQNINTVIRNKMKPSIEFVLKVSYVLGLKNVDDIFSLLEDAWVKPYRQERDATVYINMIDMTMVDTKQKRKEMKESGYEYYHIETKKFFTKEQREELLRNYLEKHLDNRIQESRKEVLEELKESGQLEELLEELKEAHKDLNEEKLLEKAINSVQSANQTKSKVIEELKDEFNAVYHKIYKKLGKRIEPYVVK